jgi:hypothetical protein
MSSDYITNKPNEPMFHCQICGEPEPAFYIRSKREHLITNQVCFGCDFWLDRLRYHWLNPDQSFIWRGTAYFVHPDTDHGAWKGHGGRQFIFTRKNGQRVVSRNTWCQGDVPDHFRAFLPDDCEVA